MGFRRFFWFVVCLEWECTGFQDLQVGWLGIFVSRVYCSRLYTLALNKKPQNLFGSFRRLWVPYFGVLIIRDLPFRVPYLGPVFSETPL